MQAKEWIPLKDCVQGGLYKIDSRNLDIGIFNKESEEFIGIRTKFGDRYLFTEYHWDTGAPYGTVKPVELLEMYPNDLDENEEMAQWLLDREANT